MSTAKRLKKRCLSSLIRMILTRRIVLTQPFPRTRMCYPQGCIGRQHVGQLLNMSDWTIRVISFPSSSYPTKKDAPGPQNVVSTPQTTAVAENEDWDIEG
ncbi:hypothetical protein DFH09DRAFT_1119552 [Mycena vulgaris]|nr:hypothetical protein DFH09DRAFT_1119552 [Mycena vulgaris]